MKTVKIYLYVLLFSLSFPALAGTIKVCKDCKIKSIQAAIPLLQDGDSLLIYSGVYAEGNITIDKSVIIKGINFPVLDGQGKNEILTIKANNVHVTGLLLKNSGKSSLHDLAAIKLQKVSGAKIIGNRLESNYFGIYLANCTDCHISQNKIQGAGDEQQSSGNGIHLWKSKGITIENNESRGHRDGIYFEFVTESSIKENISEDNLRYGLHFMFSDNDSYENNTFRKNGAGVAVMYSKNVKMKGNHFHFNWGSGAYGILLKDIRDSEILNNTFEGNTTGIYAESASRIKISNNVFLRNGWALRVTSSCDGLNINNNNFIGNTFDMATTTSSGITQNSFDGNYWDKYDGYDLNRDKKGDVPYYPVSLSTMLVEKIPTAAYFMHSFVLNLINQSERMLPNLIPEGIKDNSPSMKKLLL
jgi:nitrous oxidase accessory protein